MARKDITATRVSARLPLRFAFAGTAYLSALPLTPLMFRYARYGSPSSWAKHIPAWGVGAEIGVAALILIWGCARTLRLGVLIGDQGIVVRNFFRTYRISRLQVSCLADGESKDRWALNVVTTDGRAITAAGTAHHPLVEPDILPAVGQAARLRGIRIDLTGVPAKWQGPATWQIPEPVFGLMAFSLFMGLLIALYAYTGASCQYC